MGAVVRGILEGLAGAGKGFVSGQQQKLERKTEQEKFDWQKYLATSTMEFRRSEAERSHKIDIQRLDLLETQIGKAMSEQDKLELANTFQIARDKLQREHQTSLTQAGYTFQAGESEKDRSQKLIFAQMGDTLARDQLVSREKIAYEQLDMGWDRLDIDQKHNVLMAGIAQDRLDLEEVTQTWRQEAFTISQTMDMFKSVLDIKMKEYSTKAQANLMRLEASLREGIETGGFSSEEIRMIKDIYMPMLVMGFSKETRGDWGKLSGFAGQQIEAIFKDHGIKNIPKVKWEVRNNRKDRLVVDNEPVVPAEDRAEEDIAKENQVIENFMNIMKKREGFKEEQLDFPMKKIIEMMQGVGSELGGGEVHPGLQSLIQSISPGQPEGMPEGLSQNAQDFVTDYLSQGITMMDLTDAQKFKLRELFPDEWELVENALTK